MDVVRRSGSGQYRMELHDSNDGLVASTLNSVDGRGILVSNSNSGSYTLKIVPLSATGTWIYDIAIWPGLPMLSFAWIQNSYSSHTGIGPHGNTMIWDYTLTGSAQSYKIALIRTDGNLEYDVIVVDAANKQISAAKSSSGNSVLNLTSGGGNYSVHVTTVEGTNGSYQITLTH
jgi:hypothetical protein